MGTRKSGAAAGKNREARASPERRWEDAQWYALDCSQRSAVEGIAGKVWPLAVCVRPVCQMAGRRHIARRVLEKVKIIDGEHLLVTFKGGIEMEQMF